MNNWISVVIQLPEPGVPVNIIRVAPAKHVDIAEYFPEKTLLLDYKVDEYDGCHYDETTDEYYVPAGWYETAHEDGDAIRSYLSGVTHWQPLPPC